MAAGIYPIEMRRGAAWSLGLSTFYHDGLAKDISEYDARMQIRVKTDVLGIAMLILDMPAGSSYFTVLGPNSFKISIGATVTAGIPAGKFMYDLYLVHQTDEDDVIDLLTGEITVKESAIQ